MLAKMDPVETIIMAVGGFLVLAALLIYLVQKGRKDPATKLRFFGGRIELESQTGAFIILALGCLLVAAPMLLGYQTSTTETKTAPPPQQPPIQKEPAKELAGKWSDGNTFFDFYRRGEARWVRISTPPSPEVSEHPVAFTDGAIVFTFTTPDGAQGRATLRMSQDGERLSGETLDSYSRAAQVTLYRQE